MLGVGAVLTASFDVVARVIGTAVLTGVVSAVLWQAIDRIGVRRKVVRWITDIGAGSFYIFTLLAIWEVGRDWKMWATGCAIAACCALAGTGVWQAEHKSRRLAGLTLTIASLPTLLCWLIAIWADSPFNDEMFVVGSALAGWTAGASLCLVGHTSESKEHWRWLGVLMAAIGFVLSVVLTFQSWPRSENLEDAIFIVGSICAVVAYANFALLSRLNDQQFWLRWAAIGAAAFCACCADLLVITDSPGDDFLARLTIASAILGSAGTLAIVFISRRNRRRQRLANSTAGELAPSTFTSIEMRCPKCGETQQLAVGRSACRSCDLGFEIRVSQ